MVVTGSRAAGGAALLGGVLWAVTPLRQPVFDAGRTAAEGVGFFQAYNLLLVLIAVLLTIALLQLRTAVQRTPASTTPARAGVLGWWTVLVGHALLAAGSIPAVLLGADFDDVVTSGQDVGFVGAMVAALGAVALGLALRGRGIIPGGAAWLLAATLPVGALVTVALGAVGTPEDYLGLPLTVLYGGAWAWAGWTWLQDNAAAPVVAP